MRRTAIFLALLLAASCGKSIRPTLPETPAEWADAVAGAETALEIARAACVRLDPERESDICGPEAARLADLAEPALAAARNALRLIGRGAKVEWVAVVDGVEVFRDDGSPFDAGNGRTVSPVRRELTGAELAARSQRLADLKSALLDLAARALAEWRLRGEGA